MYVFLEKANARSSNHLHVLQNTLFLVFPGSYNIDLFPSSSTDHAAPRRDTRVPGDNELIMTIHDASECGAVDIRLRAQLSQPSHLHPQRGSNKC